MFKPKLIMFDLDGTMVGDSMHDMQAARDAGCPAIAVPYGYSHGHNIKDSNPDRVINSLAELPALVGI